MNYVIDTFRELLPPLKTSASKWQSFNCPCCQHLGHNRDTRKRAGVMLGPGIVFNCFNCKFTAGWQPGRPISDNMKRLCAWLGASDTEIKRIVFEALKAESDTYEPDEANTLVTFTEKDLPEDALPLAGWVSVIDLDDSVANHLLEVVEYVLSRGLDPLGDTFYWSPTPAFSDRLILPFWYNTKIVGYTARRITNNRPKYLSDQHPHFVFNLDAQDPLNKYVLVTEGPFDALSVNGVALLSNNIADQQARMINRLGKEVIVIPDQDMAGLAVIKQAIQNNWSVAFPNWEPDIKDCADAVLRYGKLFVIVDVIKTAEKHEATIKIKMKHLEQHIRSLHGN